MQFVVSYVLQLSRMQESSIVSFSGLVFVGCVIPKDWECDDRGGIFLKGFEKFREHEKSDAWLRPCC